MESKTTYCQKELAICFGTDGVPLSPLALKRSLECVSLDAKCDRYSLEEIQLFAAVRFTIAVQGYHYDEIADLYRQGKFSPSTRSFTSLEQIAEWWQREISSRTSKVELAKSFGIRLQAVIDTIGACGLSKQTILYSPEEVETFVIARKLIDRLHFTYKQVSAALKKPHQLQSLLSAGERPLYTKMDLAREFGLSKNTVKQTLRYSGISLAKMVYSDTERLRFIQARELISRNVRYKDLISKLDAVYPDLDVDSYEDE